MFSKSFLLASVGHINIDHNSRTPVHLDTDEQDAALADQNFVCLEARIKSLRISIYKEHSRLKCKTTMDEAQKKQLRELQRSRQNLRKRLLKDAANEKRIRVFHCIDSDDIRQVKDGVPVTYSPPLQVYALGARANLASILKRVSPDGVTTRQRDRIETLQNLIDLCHTREPHHRNSASRASKGATAQMKNTTFALKKVQTEHEIRDLQKAFEIMELIPFVLPSTICLFCLGDEELTSQAKTASFSRIDSLRRHMDNVHLNHYDPEVPLLCPHPSCDIFLQGVNHFKNHTATVHNVFLSK